MIYLTAETSIKLALAPIDFRKQIDGIVCLCELSLQVNPRSGTLFVFINRAKTMIRILHYDRNGYWLATKRLSKGRFHYWPKPNEPISAITAAKLREIIKNMANNDLYGE